MEDLKSGLTIFQLALRAGLELEASELQVVQRSNLSATTPP